jgi:hypothetical protein
MIDQRTSGALAAAARGAGHVQPLRTESPRGATLSRGRAAFTLVDWLTFNRSDLTWVVLAIGGALLLGILMSHDLPMLRSVQ